MKNYGVIRNGIVFLKTAPNNFSKLDREMSYEQVPQWLVRKIRPGWDGRKHLFNKRRMSFPVGLIHIFEKIEGKLILTNDRKPTPIVIKDKKKMKLRDYQEKAVEVGLKWKSGSINIPTGGGKTIIAISIIRGLKVKTLVTVPTTTLLYQWKEELEKYLKVDVGIWGDGKKDIKDITIGTYQSIVKDIENINSFDCLILDEAFIASEDSLLKIAGYSPAVYRFNLGATLRLRDVGDLAVVAIAGDTIANIKVSYLIKEGWLTDCEISFIPVQYDSTYDGYRDFHSMYEQYIVRNKARNKLICDIAKKEVVKGKIVLVCVTRIEHGEVLSKELDCPFLSGASVQKDRQKMIDRLRKKKEKLVVSTIFDIGVDIPSLDVVIVAAPTKSAIKTVQRVGRALRLSPNKKKVVIYDFDDMQKYFKKQSKLRRVIYMETGYRVDGQEVLR